MLTKKAKTNYAYCAGLIDGEGSIMIVPHNNHSKQGVYYDLRVVCQMSDRNPIFFLKGNFDGNLNEDLRERNGANWVAFRWTVTGIKAQRCLKKILPYLRTKREQAILGIEFVNEQIRLNKKRYARRSGKGNPYLPEERKSQIKLAEEIKQARFVNLIPLRAGAETKRITIQKDEAIVQTIEKSIGYKKPGCHRRSDILGRQSDILKLPYAV